MAQFNLSTACLLLLLSVSLFSALTESACCTKYTGSELPLKYIKGFAIQDGNSQCNIDAVIGRQVCANPTEPWVIKRIQQLKNAVQKMSGPAQGQ
ncbi:hypothetical protein JZ751_013698 [Albula glossodonta]|uniref:Chemokine interleukin-8-like domain-containing protein n=1 Tax=Albula glossodonta TaxID=121402 RepID=A0A8T2P1L6_9TELE|nr:hypothetical protein JZ751_013698 [Albula glossodonta]